MKLERRFWWIMCIIATCVIVLTLVILGYIFNWGWTGFGPDTSEPKQHAKTLWDWLQLLAALLIPFVIAVFSFRYSQQQSRTENSIALSNQQESALQAYLDKMSDLLLEKNLSSSQPDAEVRNVARARTLTVLPQLDAQRKGSLIQFLSESKLLKIISLSGANLSGADLLHANLRDADLSGADLSGADLHYADLRDTNLSSANLSNAVLHGALLHGADLRETNLNDANLTGVDLRYTITAQI